MSAADSLPSDLVARILCGNVGVSTYVNASMVSRTWRDACTRDEPLLRSVALYSGGMTKTLFGGLFALYPNELRAVTHTTRKKQYSPAVYCVYASVAVDEALQLLGGLGGLHARRTSSEYRDYVLMLQHIKRCSQLEYANPRTVRVSGKKRMRQWQIEDMYHAKVAA